ncbi:ATP-grasp domain-containing protein [Idiomarina xiamenensis]|uniref:N5-carboxyaminoimidazole ribonucleotide synthase n=1 Tax=Idiomarina xiamenensis 10-D-4 TaxID=740709 RepID=K2KA43_9GAMM|nr:ATP-grasp domain-containing protein [Idiomarina xiamenensis]EKE83407.1 phosphoribosylaminoimidazole carboxylase [Idiomarina xiamenensis 10-D-4]
MNVLVLGDGQLGQMLGHAAIQQGVNYLLYSTRENCIKGLAHSQPLALSLEQALAWADVVTWEFEHLAEALVDTCAEKLVIDAEHLKRLIDRRSQKQLCDELNIPTSAWQAYANADELAQCIEQRQQACVIKSAKGGYDGKGQWRWRPDASQDKQQLASEAGVRAGIVEDMIDFNCEVSIVGARSEHGQHRCYPLTLNHHDNGILSYSVAGTQSVAAHLQALAEQHFAALTDALDYVGVLAIEFFVVGDGDQQYLMVNEVAPRVHNSGHWTMQGSNCDQFALHMHAITGRHLPELLAAPTLMVNVIGVAEIPEVLWEAAAVDCHWYGKQARPGRKVGHVNFMIDDQARAEKIASQWAPELQKLAD